MVAVVAEEMEFLKPRDVGVTGVFGSLETGEAGELRSFDEGSPPSLVFFFFRKPRVGIKAETEATIYYCEGI